MTKRNLLLLSALAVSVGIGSSLALTAAPAQKPPAQTDALQAFGVVQKVLQHPRCQNCHIPGDAPLQFDQGFVHAQNVRRGPEGKGARGLACATCHSTENPPASYGAHMPPGAPNWQLPPPEHKMVFIGLSGGELCRQLKNKAENGGRDLAALREHLDDELVLWGWHPGVGRAPVDVPHAELVAAFEQWAAAGAPCPGT
jgi:cytochrome c5